MVAIVEEKVAKCLVELVKSIGMYQPYVCEANVIWVALFSITINLIGDVPKCKLMASTSTLPQHYIDYDMSVGHFSSTTCIGMGAT